MTGRTASRVVQLLETVNPAVTTTFVSATKNPAHPGDPVTFNVGMMSSSLTPPPGGGVQFRDGGTLIGTAPITGSVGTVASFTTSGLTLGDHSITATYVGDVDHLASTSSVLHEIVSAPAVAVDAGTEHTCALRYPTGRSDAGAATPRVNWATAAPGPVRRRR